jgi:hypothetical protein
MQAKVKLYISNQALNRQNILQRIHETVIETDISVEAIVEPMMGNEMIVYKCKGMMKYGLASMKNYMTLHVLPIYGSKSLFTKYKSLLDRASFQKGCINFNNEDEMPMDIVLMLINDCSKIDLLKIREDYLKSKKSQNKD